MLKKVDIKKLSIDILVDILASILIAIGTYNFAVAMKFPMTGITGLAMITYHLFKLPIGLMSLVFNIPVVLICYKTLGRDFFLRSIRSTIISSLFIDYIAPLFPIYQGEKILALVCTGVLSGLGYSMIFSRNSSTAGTDFLIMTLKAHKPHLSFGIISFSMEAVIILLGAIFVSKDIDGLIYGLMLSFVLSTVMDKFMYGLSSGKLALIVTDMPNEISNVIFNTIDRGATILHGEGSYTGNEKYVVMSACSKKEMYKISREIKKVDPASFLVIMESNEVHGEGFIER